MFQRPSAPGGFSRGEVSPSALRLWRAAWLGTTDTTPLWNGGGGLQGRGHASWVLNHHLRYVRSYLLSCPPEATVTLSRWVSFQGPLGSITTHTRPTASKHKLLGMSNGAALVALNLKHCKCQVWVGFQTSDMECGAWVELSGRVQVP